MKYFILLFLLFDSSSFAIESLRIFSSFDSIVVLDDVKIFKDTQYITYEDAYILLKNNQFEAFPKEVRSLGISNAAYWVAIKLKNNEHNRHFIEFQYDQLSHIECFILKENNLLHSTTNGNKIRIKDREIEHLFVRFQLLDYNEPLIYLFKITSDRPLIIAMNIGTKSELDYDKLGTIILITLFSGCLFLLTLFNSMLYFVFKTKEYVYYVMYLISFWIFIMYIHNYFFFLTQEFLWINYFIRVISAQGFHIALLFFTIYFLEVYRFSLLLEKVTYAVCVLVCLSLLFIGMQNSLQIIAFITGILTPLYCIMLAIVARYKNIKFAGLYLLGLCGFYIGSLLFWLMQIGIIDVVSIGKNVLLLGSMWEMIIFTGMLIFKIRLIKMEHNLMKFHVQEAEKERLYQSKYTSIGRTIGNIAHQWKQPLNALGAILTNMKGVLILEPKVKKKALIHSVDMSFEILKHLSETIDTFYSFLLKPYTHKSQFYVEEELASIKKILDFSFKNAGIQIRFHYTVNFCIDGNPNEFIQCVLNIVLNAKDQFENASYTEALIDIYVYEMHDMCVISIQDNAGGICIEPIEKIFDLNITSKNNSAGVGLFICKDIVENRFHGKIEVQNKDDGACFNIFIPLSNSQI